MQTMQTMQISSDKCTLKVDPLRLEWNLLIYGAYLLTDTKTIDDCVAKFANLANYQGFPHIPDNKFSNSLDSKKFHMSFLPLP